MKIHKNNFGFAPIYIVLILIFLISVSLNVYNYMYNYKVNSPDQQETQENSEDQLSESGNQEITLETPPKNAAPKRRLTADIENVKVIEHDNYYEMIDTNSKTKYSLKFPKNVLFNSNQITDEPDSKTKIKEPELNFSYNNETGSQIFGLSYNPRTKFLSDRPISESFFVRIDVYRDLDNINQQINNSNIPEPKKTKVGPFEATVVTGLPNPGNGYILTIIKIEEGHYLFISSALLGYKKDGKNDKYLDFYDQVVNSVTKL